MEEAKGREKDEIVRQEQILVDELVEVRQALLLTEVNPEREAAKKVELRERGDELDLQVTERDTKQNERDELAADVITLRSEIALETDPVIKADKEVARVAKETRVREVESELVVTEREIVSKRRVVAEVEAEVVIAEKGADVAKVLMTAELNRKRENYADQVAERANKVAERVVRKKLYSLILLFVFFFFIFENARF